MAMLCLKGVGPSPEQAHLHDERTRRLGDRPQPEFRRLLPALQCNGQHGYVLPDVRAELPGAALLRYLCMVFGKEQLKLYDVEKRARCGDRLKGVWLQR